MWRTSLELVRTCLQSHAVISYVIRPHNGFISSDILKECDKYVPSESNSSDISDVIDSDVEYSHN